jgi:hypothetical protein
MPNILTGTDAEDILNDLLTTTLENMIKEPDNKNIFLDAFHLVLDNEFQGISAEFKKTLIAYLNLKERIVNFKPIESD